VSRGNRRDDREAEARSAAASALLGSAEALESMRRESGREARPVVHHVQLECVPLARCADPDRARSVAQRVLDEVAERLLQSKAIDPKLDVRRADLERPAGIPRPPLEASGDALEQLVEGDLVEPQGQLPLVGACEEQEIRGQLGQPVGLDPHLAQRGF